MRGLEPTKIPGLGIEIWWENLKAMSGWEQRPNLEEGWRQPTIREIKMLSQFHDLGVLGVKPGRYTIQVPTPESGDFTTIYIKDFSIPQSNRSPNLHRPTYHYTRLVRDL